VLEYGHVSENEGVSILQGSAGPDVEAKVEKGREIHSFPLIALDRLLHPDRYVIQDVLLVLIMIGQITSAHIAVFGQIREGVGVVTFEIKGLYCLGKDAIPFSGTV